jgi:hypothetical protein
MLSGDTGSSSSLMSSSSETHTSLPRHTIDQLAMNMGFSGAKSSAISPPSLAPASTTSSTTLINSAAMAPPLIITPSHSQQKLGSNDDVSLIRENPKDAEGDVTQSVINKIDPIEMTSKPTTITVTKDTARRTAMLLAGPKFRINTKEIPKDKLTVNNDIIYSVSVSELEFSNSIHFFVI